MHVRLKWWARFALPTLLAVAMANQSGASSDCNDDASRFDFQTAALLTDTASRSRHVNRASFAFEFLFPEHQRAQGMPGARRARSLACEKTKHTSVVTTVTPVHPAFPAQWF